MKTENTVNNSQVFIHQRQRFGLNFVFNKKLLHWQSHNQFKPDLIFSAYFYLQWLQEISYTMDVIQKIQKFVLKHCWDFNQESSKYFSATLPSKTELLMYSSNHVHPIYSKLRLRKCNYRQQNFCISFIAYLFHLQPF